MYARYLVLVHINFLAWKEFGLKRVWLPIYVSSMCRACMALLWDWTSFLRVIEWERKRDRSKDDKSRLPCIGLNVSSSSSCNLCYSVTWLVCLPVFVFRSHDQTSRSQKIRNGTIYFPKSVVRPAYFFLLSFHQFSPLASPVPVYMCPSTFIMPCEDLDN